MLHPRRPGQDWRHPGAEAGHLYFCRVPSAGEQRRLWLLVWYLCLVNELCLSVPDLLLLIEGSEFAFKRFALIFGASYVM